MSHTNLNLIEMRYNIMLTCDAYIVSNMPGFEPIKIEVHLNNENENKCFKLEELKVHEIFNMLKVDPLIFPDGVFDLSIDGTRLEETHKQLYDWLDIEKVITYIKSESDGRAIKQKFDGRLVEHKKNYVAMIKTKGGILVHYDHKFVEWEAAK